MESEGADDTLGSEPGPAQLGRACDHCRARKVRCDKKTPCTSCKTSGVACRTTIQRERPHRQRVLISTQYEHKIDRIEERLAGIERALQMLLNRSSQESLPIRSTATSTLDSPAQKQPASNEAADSSLAEPAPADATPPPTNTPTFEGESSMFNQSTHASDFLLQAVSNDPVVGQNPEVIAALTSLREIINKNNGRHQSDEDHILLGIRDVRRDHIRSMDLPPLEIVSELVYHTRGNPAVYLGMFDEFMSFDEFDQLCTLVYSKAENPTIIEYLLFFGQLYWVVMEHLMAGNAPMEQKVYKAILGQCNKAFKITVANLELAMPANLQTAKGLTMAAFWAVDISRPSLAWTLSARAASMCISLGFHQIDSMRNDPPDLRDTKMAVFFGVYTLDKSLSLRLGRSSTIQDWDMSLPLPHMNVEDIWEKMFAIWIAMSTVQGRIYEELYSPKALLQSPEERAQSARQLVDEMNKINAERDKITYDHFPSIAYAVHMMEGEKVSHYSALTLIYRAIPPSPSAFGPFSQECLEAARAALHCHEVCTKCSVDHPDEVLAGYMHWSIINSPCTPFIVLFCHVVSTGSSVDLHILHDFVTSLYATSHLSDSLDKLYRLCKVFYNVAKVYIEIKTNSGNSNHNNGTTSLPVSRNHAINDASGSNSTGSSTQADLDPYLSALGFAFNGQYAANAEFSSNANPNNNNTSHSGTGSGMGSDITGGGGGGAGVGSNITNMSPYTNANLGSWFSGNQYIYGLLDDDLSYMPLT